MKPACYLETSIVSYLTARPSRDLVVAAHQQITHEWWEFRRPAFKLYASQLVLAEAGKGDSEAARQRLLVLDDIELLELKEEAADLAALFVRSKAVPEKAAEDALHIALAAIYGLDYLLTWNCKHIANAEIQKRIKSICADEGYEMPSICTPEELMGGQDDAERFNC
jgi:hypothetical protein